MKLQYLLLAGILSFQSVACTVMELSNENHVILAKSYDWFLRHGHGFSYVNPRGAERSGFSMQNAANPARWTSKFGSVTFTQFGRGFPIGGMNEKGLAVEMLQLDDANYNESDNQPFVNEAQWTQYQLDQFESVDEVIANIHQLRVVKTFIGIHYFVSDASGKTAVVEFLYGKPFVYTKNKLPLRALSNDPYEKLLLHQFVQNEPTLPVKPYERTSETRFLIAAKMVHQFETEKAEDPVQFAFNALNEVRLDGWAPDALFEISQWNIVYDLKDLKVYFKTHQSERTKIIDLRQIDFSKEKLLDMNMDVSGQITQLFHDSTRTENRRLIEKNFWLTNKDLRRAAASHDLPK